MGKSTNPLSGFNDDGIDVYMKIQTWIQTEWRILTGLSSARCVKKTEKINKKNATVNTHSHHCTVYYLQQAYLFP